jgi:hypothetical protein
MTTTVVFARAGTNQQAEAFERIRGFSTPALRGY